MAAFYHGGMVTVLQAEGRPEGRPITPGRSASVLVRHKCSVVGLFGLRRRTADLPLYLLANKQPAGRLSDLLRTLRSCAPSFRPIGNIGCHLAKILDRIWT